MDYQKLIDQVKVRWPDRTIRFYRQEDAITGNKGNLEWQIGLASGQYLMGVYDSSEYWEIHGFVKGWLAATTTSATDSAIPLDQEPVPPPAQPE